MVQRKHVALHSVHDYYPTIAGLRSNKILSNYARLNFSTQICFERTKILLIKAKLVLNIHVQ